MSLPKEVKILCDIYQSIKLRKFKGKASTLYRSPTWLTDFSTKFFIKASTAPFSFVDLKSLSQSVGCKINAGLIRSFVTTWGKSHLNPVIRDSENAALQHTDKVLHHYQQNKQLGPQTFVTTYAAEENLFPSQVGMKINSAAETLDNQMKETEDKQKEARKQYLFDQKKEEQRIKEVMKPLGKNHHVRACTRDRFKEILSEEFDEDVECVIKGSKPGEWRLKLVRKKDFEN